MQQAGGPAPRAADGDDAIQGLEDDCGLTNGMGGEVSRGAWGWVLGGGRVSVC